MLEDEGYKLMGAAFEVYNQVGYGMAEEVYQQCLEIELSMRGISYHTERQLIMFYKKHQLNTYYVPDLVVCGDIVVELKAVAALADEHEAQLFNYMRIARKQVGYLINYGTKGQLQWKRFILTDLHDSL